MSDRFELLAQLGKGGMGVVWKARDRRTGEVVALKLVHSLYADDPHYLARFEREVDMGRSIDSPYVVKVLGYGRQDGSPYIAMEYVDGPSLRELLEEKGKLSWQEAQPIVAQVWAGLAAAHAVNVIHRDVKPSNILIAADGTAKLADFGIARSLEATRLTGSSTMLGTPYYMAPDRTMTQASDLYAMGCVLYEMLTGTPPFGGDTPQEVLLQHVREEADLRRVPAPARPLVEALLTKEPGVRTARALPLLDALDLPPLPPQRPAPIPPPPRRPGRPRWPVAVAGSGFLAVIGGVVALAIAMARGDDDSIKDRVASSGSTPAAPTETATAQPASPFPSATTPPSASPSRPPSPSPTGPPSPSPSLPPSPSASPAGVLVLPTLTSVSPASLPSSGGTVALAGNGGYVKHGTSGYDESSRAFDVFIDGAPAGRLLICFANGCRAELEIGTLSPGQHTISTEGGSSVGVLVVGPVPKAPATFYGTVLIDGRAPAVGATIEARIGGTLCGTASTSLFSGTVGYVVDVMATDRPGCGVEGSVVLFFLDSLKAQQTGSWRTGGNVLNLTFLGK